MDATAVMEPQAPIAAKAGSRWPTRMAMVLAIAGVLFFARLSERALWSEEVRWAQIPREMVQTGKYLWPTINGRIYYDKPLGSYWLVLLASLFTGGVDETSARLPSACSGLLAVALAMLIARRLYDDDTAILTGVILATSFSFVFFARNASTDVETIAGVLAVLWIFLRNEANPPGWWTLVLWFVMALTSLTKGLLGFALPVLIIGLYSVTRPLTGLGSPWSLLERQRWLVNRWSLVGIPLAVLIYLGPFLLSMVAGGSTDGLEMVYRENIRRFFDPVNHRGPIYLYAYVIFMLAAPWSLLLPAALVHAHASEKSRGRAFALAYFWGTFIFFTLSASRRSYYLLPILPAVALLIARMLSGREEMTKAASLMLANLRRERIRSVITLIAVAGMIGYFLIALPETEPLRTQKAFAEVVKQITKVEHVALYRTREIVYYLDARQPLTEFHTPEELRKASGFVITRRRDWEALQLDGRVVVEEVVQPWDDGATAGNKLVMVEIKVQ
jgi:4-amino-4-deoxy-L-arabinose transferase-like glycosyltransferase